MSSEQRLDVRIPRQSADSTKRFLQDPRATAIWLRELPLANIGETARLVFKSLTELSHLETPDLDRLRVAEQFREPVQFLGQNLVVRYVDAAFPVATKTRKVALLNREIHSELAIESKIILSHQSELPRDDVDRKLVAVAAARALRYLHAVLLHSALVYEPYPSGTWHEIHQIFEFTRRLGLDAVAVKDGTDAQPGTATARELYLRCLLFAVVPPYRMRQRDMLVLTDALPDWAPLARLLPLSHAQAPGTVFVVDTARDEPPTYKQARRPHSGAKAYLLSTQDLAQLLRKMIENALPSEDRQLGGAGVPKPLLRQLVQAWGTGPARRFVRTRLNFDLELVIGMDNVYSMLRSLSAAHAPGEAGPSSEDMDIDENSMLEELSQFTASIFAEPESSAFEMTLSDDDSVFMHTEPSRAETPGTTVRSIPAPADKPPATFLLRTINESAGGYCLSWEGFGVPQVKVGELVGVRSAKFPERFGVGAVRWMKNEPSHSAQLGIEMLSPSSHAVDIETRGNEPALPRKGLLLPAQKHSGEPVSLLAPPLMFRADQELLIDEGSGPSPVRLTEVVETSGAFTRFHFERLEDKTLPEDEEPDRGFESLWKSL